MAKVGWTAGAAALGGTAALAPVVVSTARNAVALRRREREAEARQRLDGEAYPSRLRGRDAPREMAEIMAGMREIPMRPRLYGGVASILPSPCPTPSPCSASAARLPPEDLQVPADFKRMRIVSEERHAHLGRGGRPPGRASQAGPDHGARPLRQQEPLVRQQVVLAAYYGWGVMPWLSICVLRGEQEVLRRARHRGVEGGRATSSPPPAG